MKLRLPFGLLLVSRRRYRAAKLHYFEKGRKAGVEHEREQARRWAGRS